jgi:hypothetical protein
VLRVVPFRLTATCQFEAGFGLPFVTVTVTVIVDPEVDSARDALMPVETAARLCPTSSSVDEDETGLMQPASAAAVMTMVDAYPYFTWNALRGVCSWIEQGAGHVR